MATTEKPAEDAVVLGKEARLVRHNRIQEAKKAGFTRIESLLFAESDADVGHLRAMVRGGATHDQMCAVLL